MPLTVGAANVALKYAVLFDGTSAQHATYIIPGPYVPDEEIPGVEPRESRDADCSVHVFGSSVEGPINGVRGWRNEVSEDCA
jgi:hypothetical protein